MELAPRLSARKGATVQSLITDPPFGVDNQSNQAVTAAGKKHARKIANDESPEQAMEVFKNVMAATLPAMKPNSDIYVFTSYQVLEEWMPFTRKLFEPWGYERKATIVWEKDGPGMGDVQGTAWGMGMEFVLYYKRGNRPKSAPRRNAVIHIPQIRPDKLIHPHEKPLPLLEMFIKASTDPYDLVFDPFGGSGSLVRAARNCNRSAVAVEYDKYNFDEATRALETGDQGMDI